MAILFILLMFLLVMTLRSLRRLLFEDRTPSAPKVQREQELPNL